MESKTWVRTLGVGGLLVLAGASTGCSFLKSLSGDNTVSLEEADVRSMDAGLDSKKETICPGQAVQARVTMEIA